MPNAVRRVSTVLVGLMACASVNGFAFADAHPADLQEFVEETASAIGAPGMSAQIVDSDGVVTQAYTGVDGNGRPVDTETAFVWGSVSKQLAAATVLGLGREGVVDEATPVVDVVPEAGQMLADPATTIDDLVHHTSGLPHDITITDDWTRRGSATDVVASLSHVTGTSERGSFRYSSLNYLLLQAVVERSTNGSFAEALEREVLGPAHASSTITDPDRFVRDVPPGHVPFFGTADPIDVGFDSAGLGYGYLAGTTDELGRYASWRLTQLQNGEAALPEVDTGQGTQYGHGLFHENIEGQEVWWHSGAVPGYYTHVALIPSADAAIVLTANRYGELEAERIATVGRNLTTFVLGGDTAELPGSPALPVLGVLLGLVVVLVAVIAVVTIRLATGRTQERSVLGAGVRIGVAAVVGGIVLFGAFLGVPSLVGASLPVMWLWAPDVTLAFWILLGTGVATTALVVVQQIVGYSRFRRR